MRKWGWHKMAMKKTQGRVSRKLAPNMGLSSEAAITSAIDNEAAGNVIAKLSGKRTELEYEFRDIKLANIEFNPDNEIFRQVDSEDDIVTLAEDIQRNGLLHNLVVFPKTGGSGKYVLLSGERRWKAMDYLQKQGYAEWNEVKNCRVITSKLSENEKRVLLYSANLQVRGGFGDEMVRRKAINDFVKFLQKAPYNLEPTKAKAAVKEISTQSSRSIDMDIRIENELNPKLLKLLDGKFLTRKEVNGFLSLTQDEQMIAADRFMTLWGISEPELERERNAIRERFRDALLTVSTAKNLSEARDLMDEAVSEVDTLTGELKEKALALHNENAECDTEQGRGEDVQPVQSAVKEGQNAITKNLPSSTMKLRRVLARKGIQKTIASRTKEEREEAVHDLEQMIEAAQQLKAMIESVGD